ncbi:hypothetical protein [Patiriisocius marinus]|uniref:Por secretion system C-terminal sorting domain-containing protein n=1 Tax=Patiriisocius marinus TaxID=1397112 RepID=A0A5J4IZP6_9FLAO|nr:hypothetical protein [Patiriisocius marinus]GER59031.1 hypothetical protein ULMA_11390 [Patiriisocius marinus]
MSPTGGSVTKFNDNIINTNVTITTKDSLQINSDTMIDDLPQGLYKVEKIYNDGAIEQTVILKENK